AHRQPRPGHRAEPPRPARATARRRYHNRGDHPRQPYRRAHATPHRDDRRPHSHRHRPPRDRLRSTLVTTTAALGTHRMRPSDLARLSAVGIRTRKLRAALSGLGIAIGVAAIVAVLGLSASSQAGLLNEISRLGTNLLTVANGQTLSGEPAELPIAAPGMLSRIGPVTAVDDTGMVNNVSAYRTPLIP